MIFEIMIDVFTVVLQPQKDIFRFKFAFFRSVYHKNNIYYQTAVTTGTVNCLF